MSYEAQCQEMVDDDSATETHSILKSSFLKFPGGEATLTNLSIVEHC